MAYSNYSRSVGTVQYTNIANSFNQGSGYGAAFGSKFGPWGTLIGAGIGGTVGILGGILGNRQADKTFRQLSKVADLANQATLQELARNLGQVNRQRTIAAMQTLSALQYVRGSATKQSAASAATFAQADQIGNQLTYIQSTIKDQQQQYNYVTKFNLETQIENSNQQIISLTNQAKNMFTGVNVQGGQFSWQQALNDVMGSLGSMDTGVFKSKSGSSSSNSNGALQGSSGFYDVPSYIKSGNNSTRLGLT